MQDRELYQRILGLESPWRVAGVRLDIEHEEIVVEVEHPLQTRFCCPECGLELGCYDHSKPRDWRHLDSCQFKTILRAALPRVNCPEHGVKQISVPWAEGNSRFTMLFESFAINLLKMTQNVEGAATLLRTGWEATWNIITRAVDRGKLRKQDVPMPRIGIDEKSFAKGQSYITLLYDLDRSTVEAMADGNDTAAGNACFSSLSAEQITSVEAIAMDLSAAYVKSAKQMIPLAEEKIVHDRFHIMKLATEAVDKIRRAENKSLLMLGDNRLTGTRFLWLTSQENLTEKQQSRFDKAYSRQLETGKAWGYKELLRELWDQSTAQSATTWFNDWYRRIIHTTLTPLKKVARTIRERLANVVSFCTHGITNAVAEGINSKIQSIKRRVGGFRNRENYKNAIYFYCGGLDLHPR